MLILLIAVMLSCRTPQPPPANLQQPHLSPSDAYRLTVPIEASPAFDAIKVWKVTITRVDDNQIVYKDEASEFVGTLMVYWLWDAEDRVWLYNSDTSAVYFWEAVDGIWRKTRWGAGHEREIERALTPPEALYPPYAQ